MLSPSPFSHASCSPPFLVSPKPLSQKPFSAFTWDFFLFSPLLYLIHLSKPSFFSISPIKFSLILSYFFIHLYCLLPTLLNTYGQRLYYKLLCPPIGPFSILCIYSRNLINVCLWFKFLFYVNRNICPLSMSAFTLLVLIVSTAQMSWMELIIVPPWSPISVLSALVTDTTINSTNQTKNIYSIPYFYLLHLIGC